MRMETATARRCAYAHEHLPDVRSLYLVGVSSQDFRMCAGRKCHYSNFKTCWEEMTLTLFRCHSELAGPAAPTSHAALDSGLGQL